MHDKRVEVKHIPVTCKDKTHRVGYIFGIPVHSWPHEDVLAEMNRNIKCAREPMHISITSGELMYNARRIAFLPDYIKSARFSLCDSMAVIISGFLHGSRINRFTGPMLMEKCFEYGVERQWRHFLCGGAEGVADLLSEKVRSRFPGFVTAGTLCPPFREMSAEEEDDMIARINDAKPDILWVGLGVVKQELWISRYDGRLDVPWVVGVGGAFDYHAGTVTWAPKWIRRIGMEWLYRLCKEPWRSKRILSNHVFAFEAAVAALFGKAPVIGGVQRGVVKPPVWRGKRKISTTDRKDE